MKKFFTLIAVALVAISASAQETELKTYIDASFDRKSNDDATLMAPFQAVEYINGASTTRAQARVVKDPEDAELSDRVAKWCIEVINEETRVEDIDPETGEPKKDWQGNIQYTGTDWDAQFFITLPEGIKVEAGTKMTFSMMVKAENATTTNAATQAHDGPGGYKHYDMVGTIPFTTEWTEYSGEFTVASQADGCNTIAINLACEKNPNKYYFKDIKWSLPVPKVYDWVNIYENDGTDLSTLSVKYFKNYTDAAKSENGAIVVTSLEADKSYKDLYTDNTEGSEVLLTNDWDTQFLITLPYELTTGDKIKVGFKYWASEAANTQTQCHTAAPEPGAIEGVDGYAGTYVFYSLLGDVAFTTEEQVFDKVITIPDNNGNAITMQAITFNLNVVKKPIKYYFDNIVVAQDREVVPTAISEVKAQKIAKTIYNVAGQQIQSLQKGLNIVNGQKVYVK